jgi:hypothetical protein
VGLNKINDDIMELPKLRQRVEDARAWRIIRAIVRAYVEQKERAGPAK